MGYTFDRQKLQIALSTAMLEKRPFRETLKEAGIDLDVIAESQVAPSSRKLYKKIVMREFLASLDLDVPVYFVKQVTCAPEFFPKIEEMVSTEGENYRVARIIYSGNNEELTVAARLLTAYSEEDACLSPGNQFLSFGLHLRHPRMTALAIDGMREYFTAVELAFSVRTADAFKQIETYQNRFAAEVRPLRHPLVIATH